MGHYLKNELYDLIKKDKRIFDFIQDGSLDGLWYWDLEKPENEWMNPRFWQVLGYHPNEMPHLASAWQNIINPDDLKIAVNSVKKHLENPDFLYDQIVRYTHKKGHIVWVRCRGIAIRDEHGKPIRMLGAHQDITALKQVELKLQQEKEAASESREKYKAMYENAPVAFQSLNAEGIIIDVNPQWLTILGYNRDEVIGKWFGDFLQEDFVEHFKTNFPIFKQQGYIKDVQFKLKRKTGEFVYVSFEGCIGLDNNGAFKQTYCTFKDITKEKEAEFALLENEERYRTIFESSGIGVGYYTIDGKVVDFNSVALQNMGGLSKEEVIGKYLHELFPKKNADIYLQRIHSTLEKNTILEFEDEIELPGGKQWFLSTFSTVKNAKGEINGVQILSNNITDRKNIESQLRKNQQRLEEAQAVAHVGGWEWNLKTNESWWSKELLSIYGLKPEDDVPGIETWTEHIYKEDLEFLLKSIDDSLSSKKPYDVKYRIIRHDNQAIRWIHAKAKVIHDANNKPVTMYGTARDITKEKEAIEQLSKSEARYRHLVETASDAIYLIDDKGIIIDTNQIATRMLQKSKPEIVGSKIDTVDPNFPTEAFLNFWKQVPAGEQRIFETTHITKTGIRIPIEISGKKFIIDEKTFYFGIARDLTERKKAICALAESEEKFRSIFSCANIGISIADGKGDQIDVNDEFLRKLKYTKEEYLELNFTDFSHPDDNEKEISFIREINEGKRNNYRISKRLRKKDGEFLWFDISVTALRNDQGKVEMFFAMSIDITDQKNAIEEKSILGDMLDTAPNSITVHDEAGHFLYANQKTFKLHGYLPEEYMTLNLKEIDVPESAELIEKRIQTIKENGYGVFEVEHFRKDGSRIPLEVYVKKVSWKGNPALLSIATDISERNKWIKELVNAKEKAEEANRLKTEFLNNMSHEIRTPMNGIIGFSEMLDKEDITHEKRKYYSRIVQNSSYQLLRIIDDILEISTLETKQQKPIESEFCLNDLIMELFSIFNLKARERDVPVYIKKELPDNKSYIISDKSKLNKILSNLLENALKFTNEGFIEIGYFLKRKNLVLYVKDTGIGVSPQNQEIIFERFSQEDKEISRKHGGLGLGLSISKENAKLLGGDITVESEKGKGSIFYVTIPYRKAQKTDLNSTHTSSGVDKETNTDETLTILVAEDEEVNYLYIEALFEEITDKNITLIHAINGKEAVNLCNENNINLILMDIKMPVMGGLEATEKIKAKFPQLPIIAQTAYSTEADKQLAMKHGCNDFISKPINKEILFNMINNYVNVK